MTSTSPRFVAVLIALLFAPSVASTRDSQPAAETTPGRIEIPPTNCSAVDSRSWAIIPDATASSGAAIEHVRTLPIQASDALDICQSAGLADGEFSVRFKVISGTNEDGGLALRTATPNDYYLVKIDALRDRVSFLLTRNGVAEEIVGVDADVAADTWHTLAVRAEDDSFTVTLDENWIFTGFDKRLRHAGRIALWADSRSIARFERITMSVIPKASPWR